MDTPTPAVLLAQINAVMSTYGLKAEFVENPTPETGRMRPWLLNEETQLYERSDWDLPIVIKLLEDV